MDYCIKIRGFPVPVLLDLLKLAFVGPFKDSIAGDMVSLFVYVFLDTPENISIVDTCRLQQAGQIVNTEVPVGTSMAFSAAGRMLCEYLLT